MDRHPQHNAVNKLLRKFQQNGFVLDMVDDGVEYTNLVGLTPTAGRKLAVDAITDVDNSTVKVFYKDQGVTYLYLILGNDDDEILTDWVTKVGGLDDIIEKMVYGD